VRHRSRWVPALGHLLIVVLRPRRPIPPTPSADTPVVGRYPRRPITKKQLEDCQEFLESIRRHRISLAAWGLRLPAQSTDFSVNFDTENAVILDWIARSNRERASAERIWRRAKKPASVSRRRVNHSNRTIDCRPC
jgi:hypothetical protein